MKRTVFVLTCLAALGASALAASTPAPPTGKVAVTLPGDAGMAFKPGVGVELVQQKCSACHSSAYVSTQPVLSRAQWTAEVLKMRAAYGASSIADDQVPPIVEYLTVQYGKP